MLKFLLTTCLICGLGAMAWYSYPGPPIERPADARTALVYASISQPEAPRPERPGFDPLTAIENFLQAEVGLPPVDAPEPEFLSITTASGEVIEISAQVPPARLGEALIRVEGRDTHRAATELAAANARARAAAAARNAQAEADAPIPEGPLLYITYDYVNMRQGPSTATPVIGAALYGMSAEQLSPPQDGWTHIRLLETGQEAYVASYLVSENLY